MCPKPSGRLLDGWVDGVMYVCVGSGLFLQEADHRSWQGEGWFGLIWVLNFFWDPYL